MISQIRTIRHSRATSTPANRMRANLTMPLLNYARPRISAPTSQAISNTQRGLCMTHKCVQVRRVTNFAPISCRTVRPAQQMRLISSTQNHKQNLIVKNKNNNNLSMMRTNQNQNKINFRKSSLLDNQTIAAGLMHGQQPITTFVRADNNSTSRVTLMPGHGIGPEVCDAAVGVMTAADVPVEWDRFEFDSKNDTRFQEALASIFVNRVALKGPFEAPTTTTNSSNVKMRKTLDLFANVVPISNIPGVITRHSDVDIDIVVIRENTQGEYSGVESEVEKGVVQSLKLITAKASERIAEFAFDYALKNGRKKVTCIHKANIQKATDGLFLETCNKVAKRYASKGIKFNDMIIDNTCMQLVMNPSQFDVMVTPNLYGNIISNISSALVGGPGLIPGKNVSDELAVFEYGARHLGHTIAGRGIANPTGMIFSACLMLRHISLHTHANRIEQALKKVLKEAKVRTSDLGGKATTKQFTQAIIDNLTN